MDEKEINNFIEKRILEAKLDIADRRFNYLVILAGGLLAIFGLFFPIWQANTSTSEVEKAVEEMRLELKAKTDRNELDIKKYSEDAKSQLKEMTELHSNYINYSTNRVDKEILSFENKFKELAGTQLRKPILVCRYNGNLLENATIGFNDKNRVALLELKNIGDATAKNIRIRFYINTTKEVFLSGNYSQQEFSDEPTFNRVYDYYLGNLNSLDSKDSNPMNIYLETELKESLVIPAMMKIYYEQPDPVKYNFTIKYDFK